jgi:hypothetical protein
VVVSDRKFGQQLYGYTANTSGTGTHTYNTLANEYVYVATGGNFDQTSNTNETSYDVYLPEVLSFSDYYPFHMQMPGRFDNSAGYRYGGSNGQEKETEITGNSSHYSAEYWMYDSRLGRRWNVDPVIKEEESPYATFANNPIVHTDINGAYATRIGAFFKKMAAKRAGYETGDIYKSGQDYGFNIQTNEGLIATFSKKSFSKTPEKLGTDMSNSIVAFVVANKIQNAFSELKEVKVTKTGKIPDTQGTPSPAFKISFSRLFLYSTILQMSGCNPNAGQRREKQTEKLNEYLQQRDIESITDLGVDLNRRFSDQIVYRYMSVAEFNNTGGDIWKDVNGEAYHSLINKGLDGSLVKKYVTPDLYFSAKDAKSYLALPTKPEIVVWTFKSNLVTLTPRTWRNVEEKNKEPGGGREGTITEPFPVRGAFYLKE